MILGVHLWLSNFGETLASVRATVGVTLLGLALFHGFNGVRTVVFDFSIGPRGRKFTTMLLLLLGTLSFLFGMNGLLPLILGT